MCVNCTETSRADYCFKEGKSQESIILHHKEQNFFEARPRHILLKYSGEIFQDAPKSVSYGQVGRIMAACRRVSALASLLFLVKARCRDDRPPKYRLPGRCGLATGFRASGYGLPKLTNWMPHGESNPLNSLNR